ncbi:competence type IV pilus minor pilin ComGG [Mesobacillus maritimus]|uniref:competence type IV pilus minor pilin ComGG n=1 Tax=Mesobacillus maritimus TaxID=1643336 RepID=UPI0038512207
MGEQGFTYPLSLSVLVFFSLFLLILVEQNVMERRFFNETEKILLVEYYIQAAVVEAEQLLNTEELEQTGKFEYRDGEVRFSRRILRQGVEEVTFTLMLDTGEQWIGMAQYDQGKKKIVKWVEKN